MTLSAGQLEDNTLENYDKYDDYFFHLGCAE